MKKITQKKRKKIQRKTQNSKLHTLHKSETQMFDIDDTSTLQRGALKKSLKVF